MADKLIGDDDDLAVHRAAAFLAKFPQAKVVVVGSAHEPEGPFHTVKAVYDGDQRVPVGPEKTAGCIQCGSDPSVWRCAACHAEFQAKMDELSKLLAEAKTK